jgi:exonuclease SbcC
VHRIKQLTDELLAQEDAGTFDVLGARVADYFSTITADHDADVVMHESLPEAITRSDAVQLPYGLLSTGTKDALALSLRLAMSGFYLGDEGGLVAMDDPLVDMDPERQRRAAKVIREFADAHQVLVFTCHPSHADILQPQLVVEL